jgi:hypothetical protein
LAVRYPEIQGDSLVGVYERRMRIVVPLADVRQIDVRRTSGPQTYVLIVLLLAGTTFVGLAVLPGLGQ